MFMADRKRFLIVEDHPLYREALKGVIFRVYADAHCIEACTLDEALAAIAADDGFELILLDLVLPGTRDFSSLITLRERAPAVPIVVVSASDDEQNVRQCLAYGALGFLPKSSSTEVLENALRLVMSGGSYVPAQALGLAGLEPAGAPVPETGAGHKLTPRQLRVLALMAEGKANKQIAYELGISEITVKAHVSAILRKLGVSNRVQAVLAAKKQIGAG
jgi:DNA-binding NarL/FixJ family response regulator